MAGLRLGRTAVLAAACVLAASARAAEVAPEVRALVPAAVVVPVPQTQLPVLQASPALLAAPSLAIEPAALPVPAADVRQDASFEGFLKAEYGFSSTSFLEMGVPRAQLRAMLDRYLQDGRVAPDSTTARRLLSLYGFAEGAAEPSPRAEAVSLSAGFFQERARAGGGVSPEQALPDYLSRHGVAVDSPLAAAVRRYVEEGSRVLRAIGMSRGKHGLDVLQELADGLSGGRMVEGTFYRGMSRGEYARWIKADGLPDGSLYKFAGMERGTVEGQYAGEDVPGSLLVEMRGRAVPYGPGAAEKEALVYAVDRFRIVEEY